MTTRLPTAWASKEYPGHNVHIPGTTHYLRSRTFQSWFNMIIRTHYASHAFYKYYGGRGITVTRRWYKFENFLADMGHRPSVDMTLDRVNVNGNYNRRNCKWADKATQARNRRK